MRNFLIAFRCVHLSAVAGGLLLPNIAAAQSVRGVLTDRNELPVPGAVVLLIDSHDSTVARALSNDRGAFLISAPAADTYRLSTLRIGYHPWISAPFQVEPNATLRQSFVMDVERIALETMVVATRSQCSAQRNNSNRKSGFWEQVRTALTAAQMTQSELPFIVTTANYTRTLDRDGRRIEGQTVTVSRDRVKQPWQRQDPDQLHTTGYVFDESDSITFNAPGLEVLLSPWFLRDHCLNASDRGDARSIAVDFVPIPDRRGIAELSGTVWVDRFSSELRRLEFGFVNVSREQQRAGGMLEFARLANGAWVVSQWKLRMPVTVERQTQIPRGGFNYETEVTHLREVGGIIESATSAVRGASDTLWTRGSLAITGVVSDSASGKALPKARVKLTGTSSTATTDSLGAFSMPNVPPGEYTLEVRTAAMERDRVVFTSKVAFTDRASPLNVRIPSQAFAADGLASPTPTVGIFRGTVRNAKTNQPIEGAEVALPQLGVAVRSASNGRFQLPKVAAGKHQFVVRQPGYGAVDATIETIAGKIVEQEVLLTRLTLLDSVVVEENALLPSFEENRRMGLGKFLTREDLKLKENRTLSAVFEEFTGVKIISGTGSHAGVASTRGSNSLSGNNIKSDPTIGLKPACYSHLYIDNMPVYTSRPGDLPFDINSLSPRGIEAIEYYSNPATTPSRYSILNATCGVIVIWTRRTP